MSYKLTTYTQFVGHPNRNVRDILECPTFEGLLEAAEDLGSLNYPCEISYIDDGVMNKAEALIRRAFNYGYINGPQSSGHWKKACDMIGAITASKIFDRLYLEYSREYPQGWAYYPGDICKHGTYVGGCGYDYICGACEMGDD